MTLDRLRGLRPGKTWLVFAVAIGIGLMAALAARSYLSGRVADLEARARGKNVNVVVAKSDLPKGAPLTSSSVAVRPVPADFAHSSAVLPDQFDRIEGQALAYNVKAGEMIMWNLIEQKRPPTFSARVENGRRAITVPVDEINSISGLLEPGDLIDLMVTLERKGHKTTLTLLQSVRILATGQRAMDDPKSGERKTYSTVTLDADPEQAQAVVAARDAGRITALLRNPQDRQPFKSLTGDFSTALASREAVVLLNASSTREVPVIYGGRNGRIPPEALRLGQYVTNPTSGSAGAMAGAPQPTAPLGVSEAALAEVLQRAAVLAPPAVNAGHTSTNR